MLAANLRGALVVLLTEINRVLKQHVRASAVLCDPDVKNVFMLRGAFGNAALAAIPRGTLHVMLTKPSEAGLALSKEAEAERDAAAAAVGGFLEAAAGESLVNANPRAMAVAVSAQLRAVQSVLLDAGMFSSGHCKTLMVVRCEG